MFKLALLSLAAIAGSLSISGSLKNANLTVLPRDTRLIVELKNGVSESKALASIRSNVTDNFFVADRMTNLVNALVIDVNSSYVSGIENLNIVNDVNVSRMHKVDLSGQSEVLEAAGEGSAHSDSENSSRETMNMPEGTKEGEGVSIAILDTGIKLDHVAFTDLDQGTKVKYTKESIETLIDEHPEFHGVSKKGSTYYNSKIPFYYDYGGTSHDGGATHTEDESIISQASDHGNHVSSLAAGNDPEYKGIAPKAQILFMKVFTDYYEPQALVPSTGAMDEVILKAFDDCAILGVDIINMSLGSDLDDFQDSRITAKALNILRNNGTFVNVAAGNAGKLLYEKAGVYANWAPSMVETGIMGSYANFSQVMTVASGIQTFKFYDQALMVGNSVIEYSDQVVDYVTADGEVKYKPNRYLFDITEGGTKTDFDWVKIPGWGEAADYSKANVSGKIAIIDRGETSFLAKVELAAAKGAIAAMIINNNPAETDFTFRMDFSGETPAIPVALILYRDRGLFTSETPGKKDIEPDVGSLKMVTNQYADCPDARNISSFSTDGPKYDYELKPEITSPGDSIKGAVYFDEDGGLSTTAYAEYGGTSMATPNFCGAEAVALSEHLDDPDYRKALEARLMTTATPMVTKNGLDGAPLASPRQQGAGMVNLGNALSSSVVLEGVKYGTSEGVGKAKINLYNNPDIAKGDLKLSFLGYNNSNAPLSYTATTYVYRPDLVELDPENYPEFAGVKFQSVFDTCIGQVSENLVLQPGKNEITLDSYSLTDAEKDTINKYFVNGAPIEGFVVLTPADDSEPEISIPYLGFFGDYNKEAPVEPFDFERDPNALYPSDLTNALGKDVLGLDNMDMKSMIAVGNINNFNDFTMEGVILNETNLYKLKGFRPIGTDPATSKVDPNKLYLGNNGVSNTMIIQQYVTRSVKTNTITLTNKASGEVILVDHMFDSLFGSSEEGQENYELMKSHACIEYMSNNIIGHRAYSIIPMYSFDKDTGEILKLYPDGEYEMKMEYELVAGGTYTKTYTLHVDSAAPAYRSIKEVTVNNVLYYRVRFDEDVLSYVSVNGNIVPFGTDEDGHYVDIVKEEGAARLVLTAYDYAGGVSKTFIDLSTKYFFTIVNPAMALNVNCTLTVDDSVKDTLSITYSLTQKNKPLVLTDTELAITVGDVSIENLKIVAIDENGTETELDYSIFDGVIHFTSSATTFKLTISAAQPDNPSNVNWGLIGGAIGGGVGGAAVIGVALFLIFGKKKPI